VSGDAAGWTHKYAPTTLRAALCTSLSFWRARRRFEVEDRHAWIPPPLRLAIRRYAESMPFFAGGPSRTVRARAMSAS
jgi:hypothetical protein